MLSISTAFLANPNQTLLNREYSEPFISQPGSGQEEYSTNTLALVPFPNAGFPKLWAVEISPGSHKILMENSPSSTWDCSPTGERWLIAQYIKEAAGRKCLGTTALM